MVDATLELERLKHSLRAKGIADSMIEIIVKRAVDEIDGIIVDAVAAAVSDAVSAGIRADAKDFIAELRPTRMGNSFVIATDSGRTDFSNPPFPLLPWLLKNPKIAKDGSLYKVIPVGKPSKQKLTDITQIQTSIDDTRKQARQRGTMSGNDVFMGATTFSGDFAAQKAYTREFKTNQAIEKSTGKQSFRTASSKQNPSSQWVLPAQDKDMTKALTDINNTLKDTIEGAIASVVRFYVESY